MLSEAKIARPVTLLSRSSCSCSVERRRPNRTTRIPRTRPSSTDTVCAGYVNAWVTIAPSRGVVISHRSVNVGPSRVMRTMRIAYPPVRRSPRRAVSRTRPPRGSSYSSGASPGPVPISTRNGTSLTATGSGSQPEAETIGEYLGELPAAHPALRLLDVVGDAPKGDRLGGRIEQRVRGSGIAVARLTDAAGVDHHLAVAGAERRRDVGVADAAARRRKARHRERGRARVEDVLPERIARAAMAHRIAVRRLERQRERREPVAVLRREPRPMALGRRSGGTAEELEALAVGHGPIVVAGEERRAPVAHQRVRVGWIASGAHGIA